MARVVQISTEPHMLSAESDDAICVAAADGSAGDGGSSVASKAAGRGAFRSEIEEIAAAETGTNSEDGTTTSAPATYAAPNCAVMGSHVKQSLHPQSICRKCGKRPRVLQQRWCRQCFTDYMRDEYRPQQRAELAKLREIRERAELADLAARVADAALTTHTGQSHG